MRSDGKLSIRRQCRLLSLPRSGVYYTPTEASDEDLALMRQIDEIHLRLPYYGSRRVVDELTRLGHSVNRKRIQRLMRVMGLEGLAPGPSLSKPHPEHKRYPYLLRGLDVTRANQVWAADITYIPMAHGFLYLIAIVDWYSRMVLAWRLSNTMDSQFCVDALEEALHHWGSPEIFNTDQGAQFSSTSFTDVLLAKHIAISMDGKGRCLDNVFVERLWRSLKYEEVYMHAYQNGVECRNGIASYFQLFNYERPHSSLGRQPPAVIYFGSRADNDPQFLAA